MELKDTLNLPTTNFPMRANLVDREPSRVIHWKKINLYQELQKKNAGGPLFILHDGPPFTNGDVHIGTALNKILKDIILRYRSMCGYRTPYIPGWDCHGLPIEHKVSKALKEEKKELSASALRERCADFSHSFMKKQRQQFQRLGILADWEREYRTLDPTYEASILEVFAKFVERDQVYRGKKPVYWSIPCKTALAEAEIEYREHTSPSIYVKFPISEESLVFFNTPETSDCPENSCSDPTDDVPHNSEPSLEVEALSGNAEDEILEPISFVIWTTTPWTLPANLAIAVHPKVDYVLAKVGREYFIVAAALIRDFTSKCKFRYFKIIKHFWGSDLEHLVARHPFIDRDSPIVLADYVTTDTGTGCVHIAPGHGLEDYVTGLKYGLPTYCPIDDEGCYIDDGQVPKAFVGLSVLDTNGHCEANEAVIKRLETEKVLLGMEPCIHQYPHCWRSKTPVIFRAMDQWFIALDAHDMRGHAQRAISSVKWIPEYGENRIRGSVSARPDWCISRQRAWGVPLPIFFDENGEALLDASVIRKIAGKFEQFGSNFWFDHGVEKILEGIDLPESFREKQLRKSTDTLDVWIDSGVSHYAVLKKWENLSFPADLYLEGSDQHRGWFQSSLLTSVVINDGMAPYKAVLTHGFVVGEDGKKISKSDGKPQTADDYVNKFGADVIRLWIASEDSKSDIPISDSILNHVAGTYRTIRNTLRFQLGNLYDFDKSKDAIKQSEMTPIDRWILQKLKQLILQCTEAYEAYDFHRVYQLLNRFCSVELSATYHDILKDRLYTYAPHWKERRSSQTAMAIIFKVLVRLSAPILTFTADEAMAYFEDGQEYVDGAVHLMDWPKASEIEDFTENWEVDKIVQFREKIHEKLEAMRKIKRIGQSLDAKVMIKGGDTMFEILKKYEKDLPEFFIVSQVILEHVRGETAVEAAPCLWERCQRSWRRVPERVDYGEFKDISERCKLALEEKFSRE
ncbi:MAG: isoleucine--tRNA ligase [Puniceicoccales bacterium]|jgi:isoleucyl-tRNA synthetase|nr:isoleucine--tRNA ligase [Puniceicoccales bacterium]